MSTHQVDYFDKPLDFDKATPKIFSPVKMFTTIVRIKTLSWDRVLVRE